MEKTLYYSAEQRGLQKGLQRGMERGMEKEKRQIAQNMKSFGLASDTIAKMTGLSLDEIDRL